MVDLINDKLLADLYLKLAKNYKKFPLAKVAEDMIPGDGSSTAKILFIGEAPGFQETVERKPFVGRSGKFFRKTLIEEDNISDKDVFISNIVKVRPSENRDPTPEEIEAFKPILNQEIEIIQPKLIITLGRFSMSKFLKDVKISEVHGRLYKVEWPVSKNINKLFILPMYHPAAGLRSGKMREAFINDFKKIPKIIEWIDGQNLVDDLKSTVEEYLF